MNIEVKPTDWILPNKIGYNRDIYYTFNNSKYQQIEKERQCKCTGDICEVDPNAVSLFTQQKIVRDYVQVNSPYRGILLYHELGSGKSGASIAAAEGYIGKTNVYVMTPASLAQNYENELMKISTLGLSMKKSWTQVKIISKDDKPTLDILETYAIRPTIINKDLLVWIPLYKNDVPNAIIVKENILYSKLIDVDKTRIDETILHIIKNRYTFLSYNGFTQKSVKEIVKKGFDNSFIIIDEIHNFISRVVNGSKLSRGIYNSIMSAKNCKIVLLSGTPIINNPYELAILINLIRGPIEINELKLLKSSSEPSNKEIIELLKKDDLYKYIEEINFNKSENNIYMSLYPINFVKNIGNNMSIVMDKWKFTTDKLISNIIASLNKKYKVSVKHSVLNHYALPNNQDEFYKVFINNLDIENPKVINMDLFIRRILGTLSYYRTTGSEFFPEVLPNNIRYIPMSDYQFSKYADVRTKERQIDEANKKRNRGNKGGAGVLNEKSSVYRAFSRMVCNFAFPEDISRIYPQDIRKAIKKEIDQEEFSDSDSDDDEEGDKGAKKALAEVKKDKERDKKIKKDYDDGMKKNIDMLVNSDYLDKENLRQKYSPKYAKMLDDIQESPGSVLIYSQFRVVEGLGIFSHALDKEGYKEIVIKKTDSGYEFEDLSVFDEKYDNKRYVLFNSDRVKTNILMNIFNGAFSLLPSSIANALDKIGYRFEDQLYGKIVKIMMITQSGAEGISLKNVRRVLIMEYFWNSVRINQVIGRAVRTCSHEQLPKEERNVQIFTYIAKFTKKQLDNDFTIKTLDKELTTDQHIYSIATKKEKIINQFLTMLKIASIDCIINSKQNKPLENGYKCYNWPINIKEDGLSYTSDIANDYKILKDRNFKKLKKDKGTVVSRNGVKYVLLDDKLYDYFSYKSAGILLNI
jgi:hypothetical protein